MDAINQDTHYTLQCCIITHTAPRLDIYISELIPFLPFDISRSQMKKLITSIEVNHKQAKLSYKPMYKDALCININMPSISSAGYDAPYNTRCNNSTDSETDAIDYAEKQALYKAQYNTLTILYEDEYLLAIDKPQGMVVHPGVGNTENTLSQIVFHTLSSYKKNTAFQSREGIVHRLDKDTSGVILIAKTARMHDKLSDLFSKRAIQKKYIAIVKKRPQNISGEITGYIARHPKQRKKFAVVANESKGKYAHTSYRVLFSNGAYSIVVCEPHTGRTHQIRVHMQHLGCPIVGDTIYARDTTYYNDMILHDRKREMDKEQHCPNDRCSLILHSYEIHFSVSIHNEVREYHIQASIPPHIKKAMDMLQINDDILTYI